MSTLILIERVRVLVCEKTAILREDLKTNIQTKKMNEKKTGNLR
jgi:hypothetical protein